jgi:NADPH:quinone reductase-like Zn-dependent oxidoreductase
MRAIAEDEFGGPVALMTLPIPEIGAGEVLIRVRVAGVNPFDWKVADGVLKDEKEHRFPLIPGFDAAGVFARERCRQSTTPERISQSPCE